MTQRTRYESKTFFYERYSQSSMQINLNVSHVFDNFRGFFFLCKQLTFRGNQNPNWCSHWAFSLNLFHQQIVQKAILQINDSENKKCSPWKVFGRKHPQNLWLLSRRGPRSPDARLSQHYNGPKMTFQHFSNFCRKKFPGLKNENFLSLLNECRGLVTWFLQISTPKAI